MKVFYPYLLDQEEIVTKQIKLEEEKFLSTLESGEKKLLDYIKQNQNSKLIKGDVAFLLYDTFGFPIELTVEASEDKGFTVDIEGFKKELEKRGIKPLKDCDKSLLDDLEIVYKEDDVKTKDDSDEKLEEDMDFTFDDVDNPEVFSILPELL